MSHFDDEIEDEYVDDFPETDANPELDDDDEPTVMCSNCGFEMLEIAWQCPRCGEIPTAEFHQKSTQPRWVFLTALILLVSILWWILMR